MTPSIRPANADRPAAPAGTREGPDAHCHCCTRRTATLDTDPQRLGQVLKNLLSNALKFTERARWHCMCRNPDDTPSFAVKDTGVGIPAHQQEPIFDGPSARPMAAPTAIRRHGLGLPISRDLPAAGRIDPRAEHAGRNSVFTLVLPRNHGAPSPRKRPRSTAGGTCSSPCGGTGRRTGSFGPGVATQWRPQLLLQPPPCGRAASW